MKNLMELTFVVGGIDEKNNFGVSKIISIFVK
jgi:hypothetical protein